VPVNDARVIVRIIERVTELARPFVQLVRFKNLVWLVGAQIGKRVAVDVFHRDAARLIAVHEIVNANDVLVRQVQAAPRLALHVAQHRAIVDDQLGEKLERDVAFELVIVRQPDDAHAAAAERLDQSVAVEDFLPVGKVSRSRIQAVSSSLATHARQINERAAAYKAKKSKERWVPSRRPPTSGL